MGGMIDERGAKHFLATLSYDIRLIDELTAQVSFSLLIENLINVTNNSMDNK